MFLILNGLYSKDCWFCEKSELKAPPWLDKKINLLEDAASTSTVAPLGIQIDGFPNANSRSTTPNPYFLPVLN